MNIPIEEYDIYIKPGSVDMRQGASGLASIVQHEMGLEPFSKSIFIFCGKRKNSIKAIAWDRNGWLMISKRLECRECFKWPSTGDEARRITLEQVFGLLRGNDVFREFETYFPKFA